MKKSFLYALVCTLTIFTAHTEIIESDTLTIILNYLDHPNTLIVFDIDNTLARPQEELGSDEWFCYLVDTKMAEGYDKIAAINATLPLCYYAQFNLPLIPTEANIPQLLRYCAQHNIYTMALTARGLFLAERTYEQLMNINITFRMPSSCREELLLPMKYPCLYKYNTIFTSNNDKGDTLLMFLDAINYHPECIIFVDDKMYNVQSIEKAALSRNIDYIGIRYSGCDKQMQKFDPLKANQQLQELRTKNRFFPKKSPLSTEIPWWYYPLYCVAKVLSFL